MESTSRRRIARMADRGQYAEAEAAVRANAALKTAQTRAAQERAEADQALQWLAFSRARRQYAEEAARATMARRERQARTASTRFAQSVEAHYDDFEPFASREEATLARRPVTHSPAYVHMKRREAHLAQQGRFSEAAAVSRQAAVLSATECRAAEAEKDRQLDLRLRKWEESFEAKQRNTARNLHARELLEDRQAHHVAAATSHRLGRMQDNMAAEHGRQYDKLSTTPLVRGGGGEPYCTATRGTRLERKAIVDQQRLPPLCALYSHLLS